MKQGSNGKGRSRGRNNNQQPKGRGPSRNQTFDSNGPGVRVRGNAHQVVEKYQALARDAAASGDRVLMENYLQHAEHYYRIILVQNQNNPVKVQRLDQGNALVGDDDYMDEDGGSTEPQQQVKRQPEQTPVHDMTSAHTAQPQDRSEEPQADATSGENAQGDEQEQAEKKPRRRSRTTRAREAGDAERKERDAQADTGAASAADAGPQSPAELAAAVTERETKRRTTRAKPAPAAEAKPADTTDEGSAEVHDLSEEAPKKPRRRRTRATPAEDTGSKEVANG